MSGEARLDNLTQNILRPVDCDCGGVAVLYRDPKQESTMTAPKQDNDPVPLTGLTI